MKLSGKITEEGAGPFEKAKLTTNQLKMPKIWILVTNAEKARLFCKADSHLEKIGEMLSEEGSESEITNETSGRMSNPFGGGGRHRMEAHDDALQHGTGVYLKSLAKFLDQAAVGGAYDRLILAASPKTLGELRPMLGETVNRRICSQLSKDLTHLSEKQLFDYLDEIVWI